ncbi:BON domain-containing protein [Rhizobium dioscoreae]|uniref:BON domain-containing protein n=1 Tax=Rhizobium dioscoreae TaxID=2653122 RepID=A0ABQ0Z667_9HYPH|nr:MULTISPECIES: BON domain-containing protein [Rhizobium]GES40761.1 BON domain-containing protein [Rhizobium dioscoreae]GES50888.1 BON domain-containing protein [Rhizobium dioscoreae]GLU82338.1 BON domain-containing protein [Rhizobium sp. NBRC 114257]
MDDITLRQNILDELEFEPKVDAAEIGVTARDGVITLTGHVGTYAEKDAAEKAARRVKGVRAIAQEIDVRILGPRRTDDDDIARRAVKILDWNISIPKQMVQIRVCKGVVTLTGNVEWQYQKNAAAAAVRDLAGVVGVSNLIEVVPGISADDVKKRIENALERDAELEARAIQVDVSGGKVTLKGKVRTWSERRAAERAAWSAPGVCALDDQLAIT